MNTVDPKPAEAAPGNSVAAPAPPSTPDAQPFFPRAPGETPRAFGAFMTFFQLGHARSCQAVADKLGEGLPTVKNWASASKPTPTKKVWGATMPPMPCATSSPANPAGFTRPNCAACDEKFNLGNVR